MSGRLDSNQRPPEPHIGWRSKEGPFFRGFSRIGRCTLSIFYGPGQRFPPLLLPLLPSGLSVCRRKILQENGRMAHGGERTFSRWQVRLFPKESVFLRKKTA